MLRARGCGDPDEDVGPARCLLCRILALTLALALHLKALGHPLPGALAPSTPRDEKQVAAVRRHAAHDDFARAAARSSGTAAPR